MTYDVTIHLASGVVVTFDTSELRNYGKLLKKQNKVFVIGGSGNTTQYVPVRNILAIEVAEVKTTTKKKEKQNGTKT